MFCKRCRFWLQWEGSVTSHDTARTASHMWIHKAVSWGPEFPCPSSHNLIPSPSSALPLAASSYRLMADVVWWGRHKNADKIQGVCRRHVFITELMTNTAERFTSMGLMSVHKVIRTFKLRKKKLLMNLFKIKYVLCKDAAFHKYTQINIKVPEKVHCIGKRVKS